jgi:hypothetical protein
MPAHQEMLNLFVLVDDKDSPVRRIPLTRGLQSQVTKYLSPQINTFPEGREKVGFSGQYTADETQIFCIEGYKLDASIMDIIEHPLKCEILDLRKLKHRIVAIFTGKCTRSQKLAAFQSFDPRKMLSKGFTLINSGDTYTKLEDPGITLQENLTALYAHGELLFHSYHNTRHFLDLSDYYREATDADVARFASNRMLFISDRDMFMGNVDSIIRKKITLLQKNRVLGKVSAKKLQDTAKHFGVPIRLKNSGKIVVPDSKKELIQLLRFLDEDYFDTVLTKRRCLTNSKMYI